VFRTNVPMCFYICFPGKKKQQLTTQKLKIVVFLNIMSDTFVNYVQFDKLTFWK